MPQTVRRVEHSIVQIWPADTPPQELLNPGRDAHHLRLPRRALESDAHRDQQTHQPDLGALITLTTADGRAEPLVIEVVKTIEHEGEQAVFLLAIDHSRQIGRYALALPPRRRAPESRLEGWGHSIPDRRLVDAPLADTVRHFGHTPCHWESCVRGTCSGTAHSS